MKTEVREDAINRYLNIVSGDTLVCKIPFATKDEADIGDISKETALDLASRIKNIFDYTYNNNPNYL